MPANPINSYVEQNKPYAEEVQQKTGIPISVTLAQGGVETGWGKSVVGNNHFGIKSNTGVKTTDTQTGAPITQAGYGSAKESYNAYGDFLTNNSRYKEAFNHKDDPKAFASAVAQAGYSEKPQEYEKTLHGAIDEVNKALTGNAGNSTPQKAGKVVLSPTQRQSLIDQGIDPDAYQTKVNKDFDKGGESFDRAYRSYTLLNESSQTPIQKAGNDFTYKLSGTPTNQVINSWGQNFMKSMVNGYDAAMSGLLTAAEQGLVATGIESKDEFEKQRVKNIQDLSRTQLTISPDANKDPLNNPRAFTTSIGNMVGTMAPLMAANLIGTGISYLTAQPEIEASIGEVSLGLINPIAMASVGLEGGLQFTGQAYENLRQKGATHEQAMTGSLVVGLPTGIAGMFPVGVFAKNLGKAVLGTISEDAIATILKDGVENISAKSFQDAQAEVTTGVTQFVASHLKNYAKALPENIVAGSGFNLISGGTSDLADKMYGLGDPNKDEAKSLFKDALEGAMFGGLMATPGLLHGATHETLFSYIDRNRNRPEKIADIKEYANKVAQAHNYTPEQVADLNGTIDKMQKVATAYGSEKTKIKEPEARFQIFKLQEESEKVAASIEGAKKTIDELTPLDPAVVADDVIKQNKVIELNTKKNDLINKYKSDIGQYKKAIDYNEFLSESKKIDDEIVEATKPAEKETKPAEKEVKQEDPFDQQLPKVEPKPDEPTDLDALFNGKKAVEPKTIKDVVGVPLTNGNVRGEITENAETGNYEFTSRQILGSDGWQTVKQPKVTVLGSISDWADKPFSVTRLQPEDVDQYQLRQKMEREQIRAAKKKAAEVPLESLNGKPVKYKGVTGTLSVDEVGKVAFEGGGKTYDISTEANNRNALDYGIEPIKTPESFKVSDVSETEATVNGTKYNIHTDDKGNISGVSPIDKPEQVIKNEKLLSAVESERNKSAFQEIKNISEKGIEEVKKSLPPTEQEAATTLQNIYANNMNEPIANAIEKLYAGGKITTKEQAGIEFWGQKVREGLNNLLADDKYKDSPLVKEAIDNLDFITKTAKENVNNTGENGAETTTAQHQEGEVPGHTAEGDKSGAGGGNDKGLGGSGGAKKGTEAKTVRKAKADTGKPEVTPEKKQEFVKITKDQLRKDKAKKRADEGKAPIKGNVAVMNAQKRFNAVAAKFEPTSIEDAVKTVIAGGRTISSKQFADEIFPKGSTEFEKTQAWQHSEKGETIDDVALSIQSDWNDNHNGDVAPDTTEIRDIIHRVLNDNDNKVDLQNEIADTYEERKFMAEHEGMTKADFDLANARYEQEQDVIKHYGIDREESEAIFDEIDNRPISEEEINTLADDYNKSDEAKEIYGESEQRGESPSNAEDTRGAEAERKIKEEYDQKIKAADKAIQNAKAERKAKGEELSSKPNLFGGDTGAEKDKGLLGPQKDDYSQIEKVLADLDNKIAEAEANKQKLLDQQERDVKAAVDMEKNQGNLFQRTGGEPITKETAGFVDRVLKKAFPNIKTNNINGGEFEKRFPGSKAIAAFDPETGEVFINTDKITGQTQVHEMGHVFIQWAKKFAPDVYKKLMEAAEGETGLHDAIRAEGYNLEGDALHDETAARAIGIEGEKQLPGIKEAGTLSEKFKAAIGEMWQKVKNYVKNRLGIKDDRFDNIKDMPFNEMVAGIARELLSGKEISDISSEELSGIEKDGITRYMKEADADQKFKETAFVKGGGLGLDVKTTKAQDNSPTDLPFNVPPKTGETRVGKEYSVDGLTTMEVGSISPLSLSMRSISKVRDILGSSSEVTPDHITDAVDYFSERIKKQLNEIATKQGGKNAFPVGLEDIKAIADKAGTREYREAVQKIVELIHSTPEKSEVGDIEAVKEASKKFDFASLPREAKTIFNSFGTVEAYLDRQEQLEGNLIVSGDKITSDPNAVKEKFVSQVKPFLNKWKGKNAVLDKAIDVLAKVQLLSNDISTYAVQWTADTNSLLSKVVYGLKKSVGGKYRLMVDASEPIMKELKAYLGSEIAADGGEKGLPISMGTKKLKDLGGVSVKDFFKDQTTTGAGIKVPDNPDVLISKGERLKALMTIYTRPEARAKFFGEKGRGYFEFQLPERGDERKVTRYYVTEDGYKKLLEEAGDKLPSLMKGINEGMATLRDAEAPVHKQLMGVPMAKAENYVPDRIIRGDESFEDFNKSYGYLQQQSFLMKRGVMGDEVYESRDIAEVLANRIEQGANYATRAIPMHNFETSINHLKGVAKEQGMERYIDWANKYMSRLHNPEPSIGKWEKVITRNYVMAAIGINPFVDLKHLSTMFFANNVIPQKYLLSSVHLIPKTYVDIIKNSDLFSGDSKNWSPEMQRAMQDDFFASRRNTMNTEFQRMVQEGKSFTFKTTVGGKPHEVSMSAQDVMVGLKTMETSNGLATYVAAEKYVAAEFPHLKEGTKEYKTKVGDLYMDAILQSQPAFDDVNTPFFQAGAYSEARGPLHRALSLFTGQVFAQWNGMAQRMMIAAENPTPKNNYMFAKSAANIFILNTLMVGSIDSLRQKALGKPVKDEDKQWFENTLLASVKELPVIGGVMAAVVEKVQGNQFIGQGDISLPVLEVANKLTTGLADAIKEKPEKAVKELTDFGAETLGIPLTPIREARKLAQ